MSKEEIQRSLETLQAELTELEGADDEMRRRVGELIAAIQTELDAQGKSSETERTSEGVTGLIEQFEVEHPTITATLNRIMTILGESGI